MTGRECCSGESGRCAEIGVMEGLRKTPRHIALWLSVPLVVILSSRIFVYILNYLVVDSFKSFTHSLNFSNYACLSAEFVGHVYPFGAAAAGTFIVALVCVGLAIASAYNLDLFERANRNLRLLASVGVPSLMVVCVAMWFFFGDFFPSIATHALEQTLDTALGDPAKHRIRWIADVAIFSGLVAWVFISTLFAWLVVAEGQKGDEEEEERFMRVFTFTLFLASLPLLGITTTLYLLYSMGGTVLADAPLGVQDNYAHISRGLVAYWAVMVSSTLAITAIFVFVAAGIRFGSLSTWLRQPTFSGVLTRGAAILAPLMPPILDGLATVLSAA